MHCMRINTSYILLKKTIILFVIVCYNLFISSCKRNDYENTNHTSQVETIIHETNALLRAGKVQSSISFLDSSYRELLNPGTVDLWQKYDFKVNFYLHYDFDLKKSRLYSDSLAFILKNKEFKYKTEYFNTLFDKGDVRLAERRYTEAFKFYYDGRTFARKYIEKCSYYQFTRKLGLVRYNQKQYLKAVTYLKEALVENATCKENKKFDIMFMFPQSDLNTIGLSYERSNIPDSALLYYNKALAFINQNGNKYPNKKDFTETARAVIYGNIGGLNIKRHKYKEAEENLKESIRINSIPGHDFEDAQSAKLKLADLYISSSQLEKGKEILYQLETYLGKKKNNPTNEILRSIWYKLKWDYFSKMHKHFEASQYLHRFHLAQDSINLTNNGLTDIDMDEVFKDTAQQYKLALLNKDNEIKTGYLVTFIIFSMMTICMLVGVWYSLRRSKRLNGQMAEQNLQMQEVLNSLEQSQRENTNILKIVAHDLRNPIGGMTTLAGMMLEDQWRIQEDKTMLELIQTSGKHSLELVNDLLKVNTQIKELEKEDVDLYVMLQYCVNLLLYKAKKKKQNLKLNAHHINAYVNREKMWRVISNLISNAIKFSPEHSTISVHMEQLQENNVIIRVKDNGIGIPEHMNERIFDMFTTAQRQGTDGEQPFGLGLAISKQIIEAHDGKIWFNSVVDKGTTFFVEIPLEKLHIELSAHL